MSTENNRTISLSMFEFICIIGGLWSISLGIHRIAQALERAHPEHSEIRAEDIR